MKKCGCGGTFKYTATVVHPHTDEGVFLYTCNLCGMEVELTWYRYTPSNCPKHHWQFEKWGFKDGYYRGTHRLFWVMKCDRCGLQSQDVRWDMASVGRQRVEIEDPRVLRFMDLNKDTARFILDKELAKEFWE